MKICLLCEFYDPHIRGGAEVCSKFIAEGLATKKVEIHVLTPNLDMDEDTVEKKNDFLYIHRFKSSLRRKILAKGSVTAQKIYAKRRVLFDLAHGMYMRYSIKNLAKAFNKLNKTEKFDIVHANNVEPSRALEFIKDPILKISHIRDYHIFKYKIKADRFIAINSRMKGMAEEQGWQDITIIHDPIENYKKSNKSKEEAKKSLNLDHENICLFVGHFMAETDPTILVDIAKRLSHIDFILCGDGPIKIETSLKNVHMIGRVPSDKIADYYKAADLLVYLSKINWGFGLAVIEAMANEIPVLSYRIGGIDEVIDEGVNGFFTSEDKLEGALIFLFKNKIYLHDAGIKAGAIKTAFDKETILDQLKDFFEECKNQK